MTEPVQHESHARIDHRQGRTAERIALVGVVLLLVAIVKPWGRPAASPEPATPARPVFTAPAAVSAIVDDSCFGWRWLIETDERWAGRIVRTGVLTDAVEVDAPTDPAIRFVVVAAQHLVALGFCPAYDGDTRPNTNLTIYRLGPPVTVVRTSPSEMPRSSEAAANRFYRPAIDPGQSPAPSGEGAWPAGRYVFRVDGPNGYRRWLGVEVRPVDVPLSVPALPG